MADSEVVGDDSQLSGWGYGTGGEHLFCNYVSTMDILLCSILIEGRIYDSNHVELLDPALSRPGKM